MIGKHERTCYRAAVIFASFFQNVRFQRIYSYGIHDVDMVSSLFDLFFRLVLIAQGNMFQKKKYDIGAFPTHFFIAMMTVNGILYAFSCYVEENFLSLIGIVGS